MNVRFASTLAALPNLVVHSDEMAPMVLQVEADKQICRGFNRIYERALATGLRRIYNKNAAVFRDSGKPFKHQRAADATTIRAWDDAIQTVSYGWKDVDEYYANSGSTGSIAAVRVPTLCIQVWLSMVCK